MTQHGKTRVVQSIGDPGKWQAQYHDSAMELWFDIGDAQDDRADAVARSLAFSQPRTTARPFSGDRFNAMPPMATLTIHNDATHWQGTFGILVTAMLKDILSDGAAVERVHILATLPDDDKAVFLLTGTVTDVDSEMVTFSDGTTVGIANMLAIGV